MCFVGKLLYLGKPAVSLGLSRIWGPCRCGAGLPLVKPRKKRHVMERHLGDCLQGAARRAIPLVLGVLVLMAAGPAAAQGVVAPRAVVVQPGAVKMQALAIQGVASPRGPARREKSDKPPAADDLGDNCFPPPDHAILLQLSQARTWMEQGHYSRGHRVPGEDSQHPRRLPFPDGEGRAAQSRPQGHGGAADR